MNKQTLGIVVVLVIAVGLFFAFYEKPTMSDQEAAQIVQHEYVKNPSFATAIRDSGDYYIIAVLTDNNLDKKFIVLKQVADLWQEQPAATGKIGWLSSIFDMEKIKLGNNSYLFFTTVEQGSAAGSIFFTLFSPSESHFYTISVFGANGNVNQPRPVSDDVKNNKKVNDYLLQQIAASPKVAHITNQDLNTNSPENAVRKWQLDNENIWTKITRFSATPVNFTYYDQNLFNSWAGPNVVKEYYQSITSSVENDHYKFVAYFKGVVIGYDKTQSKYFVLWVPSDMYEWPTDIAFIDANTVHINSANSGPSVTIHLNNNTITSP